MTVTKLMLATAVTTLLWLIGISYAVYLIMT